MNPLGLIVIGLGVIMIYIGWKGSQHSVISSFTGKRQTSTSSKSATNPAANGTAGVQAV